MTSALTAESVPRADRITMRIIGVLAAIMGLALAAGQFTRAAHCLWGDEVGLTLLADQAVPVRPGTGVRTAEIETVSLTVDALAMPTRALFAVGAVLLALTALAVAGAVTGLLLAAASGRPFRPRLYRFSLVAGLLLVVGPLTATAITGFASMMAADELNDAVDGILLPGFEVSSWGMTIPVIGLAVIALGYLFRRMEGLQHETDGLV